MLLLNANMLFQWKCGFSLIFVFVFYGSGSVFGSSEDEYCSKNLFDTNQTFMQFTKEAMIQEFAISGSLKYLHCCAKGYQSIEWLKNGQPYPWRSSQSQFILYPDDRNQTIYAMAVTFKDSGNYTCLLRNNTVVHSHMIDFRVFEENPEYPKVTYISPDTEVYMGKKLRLFCEAFADPGTLPDARTEISWYKIMSNGSEIDVKQEKVEREGHKTYGTYLTIELTHKEDFGEYICRITKPGSSIDRRVSVVEKLNVLEYVNPNPVPVGKLVLFMSAIVFILVTMIILNIHYGLLVRVRIKDRFGTLDENDGKDCDILVVYGDADQDTVQNFLLPKLQHKFGYKCGTFILPHHITSWTGRMTDSVSRCRRLVAVISPAALNGNWDHSFVLVALKTLDEWRSKLTCIAMRPLPYEKYQTKNSEGETLGSLVHHIHMVQWQRADDDKFWLALRLKLPPKRINSTTNPKNNLLTMAQCPSLPSCSSSSRMTSSIEEDTDFQQDPRIRSNDSLV